MRAVMRSDGPCIWLMAYGIWHTTFRSRDSVRHCSSLDFRFFLFFAWQFVSRVFRCEFVARVFRSVRPCFVFEDRLSVNVSVNSR